jgi:hypothetical protein
MVMTTPATNARAGRAIATRSQALEPGAARAGGRLDLRREDRYRGRAETEAMSLRSKKGLTTGPSLGKSSQAAGRCSFSSPVACFNHSLFVRDRRMVAPRDELKAP